MNDMLKRIIQIVTIVTTFFLISCTKILNTDIPGGDDQIVVNVTLCPDSAISLILCKSKNVLDSTSVEYINSAGIFVYENNTLTDTLKDKGNGLYLGSLKPSIKRAYTIKVKTTSGINAECTDSIPEMVKIQKIDTAVINNPYSQLLSCTISIEDPTDRENYYILKILSAEITDSKNIHDQKYTCYNMSDYIYNLDGGNITFFSDNPFNGKTYTLLVSMLYPKNKIVYFQLWSINKALYDYCYSIVYSRLNSADFFSENTKIVSNIKGGLGIMGAYTIYTDSISVE
jgi:hypothetical protein